MARCADCGLRTDAASGEHTCFLYRRPLADMGVPCPHFIARVVEDGKPLTPFEHWLLKEAELNGRR